MKFRIVFIQSNKTVEVETEKEVTEEIKKVYPDATFDPTTNEHQRMWNVWNRNDNASRIFDTIKRFVPMVTLAVAKIYKEGNK
jgi:hypothetical protein